MQSIQDTKEHLIILRGEISTAANELNALLAEKDRVTTLVRGQIKSAELELSRVTNEILRIEQSCQDRLEDVGKREDAVTATEEELAQKVKGVSELFEKTKEQITALVSKNRNELVVLAEDKEAMEEAIWEMKNYCDDKYQTINEQDKKIQEKSHQLDKLNIDIARSHSELRVVDERLVEAYSELNTAEEFTQAEADKRRTSIEAISEREENLLRREKNFQIVKARLAKAFAMIYPDQNLDNLI